MLASAVAIGLCFYVAAGVLALVFARATLTPEAKSDETVRRYHAMLHDYTDGWRGYAMAAAIAAYAAAAIALFSRDGAAVYWLAAALVIDCVTFFLWPQRRAFIAALSPQERMSDAVGVAALTMALGLTAYLRFSGALA
jgi:hypothetical protein